MNAHTYVTHLEHGASRIRLSAAVLMSLSLKPHDCLYAIIDRVLEPSRSHSDIRTPTPFATVYASPLPHKAWGRLVQASFNTGPGPGTAASLCESLEALDLYARLITTAEQQYFARAADPGGPPSVIVPDTTVVFEFPRREFRHDSESHPVSRNNCALHERLEQLVMNPDDPRMAASCVEVLKTRLANTTGGADGGIRVNSVVPLRALNRIATGAEQVTTLTVEEGDQAKGDASLQCDAWRRELWPESRLFSEEARHPEGSPIAVLVNVDSDQKIVTLHFFRLENKLIASFDVVIPAAGLEHRWWRWVYDEIGRAGGTILASQSSARLQGRWGTLSLICAFAAAQKGFNEKNLLDDIGHAIRSIGHLKGKESTVPSQHFQRLREDIERPGPNGEPVPGPVRERAAHYGLGLESARHELTKPARLASTLRNIRLWYHSALPPSRAYEQRFGQNPFSFTRPLDLEHYSRLYPLQELRRTDSRALLADRLADHLGSQYPENVVLVGAYRSGKTTVMNMVVDELNRRPRQVDGVIAQEQPVLAVKVNAAVTPPDQLFIAVYHEVRRLSETEALSSVKRTIARHITKAAATIAHSFDSVLKAATAVEIKFMIPLIAELKMIVGKEEHPVQADGKADKQPKKPTSALTETTPETDPAAQQAGRLRASVTLLRMLLQKAATSIQVDDRSSDIPPERWSQIAATGFRVVVALDEVADTTTWGATWAFPAWRQLIEDPGFREARWLFSSTRPLGASTGYSPLGNAMREYNMEPLRKEEANALVSAFESWDAKWWADTAIDDEHRLRPVVSFHAAKRIAWLAGNQPYLMQKLCCHLFEECIRSEVPIVGSRMVKKVVERKVLPELGDYFTGQWSTFEPDHCLAIRKSVKTTFGTAEVDVWRICPDDEKLRFECSPELQKALERAGLGSPRLPMVLVPLFLMWMQEHFADLYS